eukprot:TRINITY_DN5764_c0_g1_i2.p1 TRINITY_DN5764_c0_g1~~TRINITY_DN5764_c0_g1_i2.p1  ORF type:complete len:2678 (+),score=447.44 TRINITY_DN5764_c0_g1_i2:1203-9236(+)
MAAGQYAEQVLQDLRRNNEYAGLPIVRARVGAQFAGVDFVDPPSVQDVRSVERELDPFISALLAVRPILTAHDLLLEILEWRRVQKFEDLGLGPFLRHPLVVRAFSPPPGTNEVPNISTEDVVRELDAYRQQRRGRVEVVSFMQHLGRRFARDPLQLLVRVTALGPYITVVQKARAHYDRVERNLTSHLDAELSRPKQISFPDTQDSTEQDILQFVGRFKELCEKSTVAEAIEELKSAFTQNPEWMGEWTESAPATNPQAFEPHDHPQVSDKFPSLSTFVSSEVFRKVADHDGFVEVEATVPPGGAGAVMASIGYTGAAFTEVRVLLCSGTISIGWGTCSVLDQSAPAPSLLITFSSDGCIRKGNSTFFAPPFGSGAVVGIALDSATQHAQFCINQQVVHRVSLPADTPPLFPLIIVRADNLPSAFIWEWNLGARPWVFRPPPSDATDSDSDTGEAPSKKPRTSQYAVASAPAATAPPPYDSSCNCPCHSATPLSAVVCVCSCVTGGKSKPAEKGVGAEKQSLEEQLAEFVFELYPRQPLEEIVAGLLEKHSRHLLQRELRTNQAALQSKAGLVLESILIARREQQRRGFGPALPVVPSVPKPEKQMYVLSDKLKKLAKCGKAVPITLLRMAVKLVRVYLVVAASRGEIAGSVAQLLPPAAQTQTKKIDTQQFVEAVSTCLREVALSEKGDSSFADVIKKIAAAECKLGEQYSWAALPCGLSSLLQAIVQRPELLEPFSELKLGQNYAKKAAKIDPVQLESLLSNVCSQFPLSSTTPRRILFSALSAFEKQVAKTLQLPNFSSTGWESGAALLEDHPALAEKILQAFETEESSNAQIKKFISRCLQRVRPSVLSATQVEACICRHFRLSAYPALRDPTNTLIASAAKVSELETDALPSLAISLLDASDIAPGSTSFPTPSRGEVEAALFVAPLLTDLQEWTQWDVVFQEHFGEFSAFIASVRAHEKGLCAVECSVGVFVWVPANATPETYRLALTDGDATSSAQNLASIIALSGGVSALPIALLTSHATAAFAAQLAHGAASARRVCQFTWEIITLLPSAFLRTNLVYRLLLQPLIRLDASSTQTLFETCPPSCLSVLFRFGLQEGISTWATQFRETVLGQTGNKVPRQPQPMLHRRVVQTANEQPAPMDTVEEEPVALTEPIGNVEGRSFLESIAREEFGVGLAGVDGPAESLILRQNARLGRALQRLSVDLYSKDTHFVLELVQNADDNAYSSKVLPTFGFVFYGKGIVTVNNEIGFSEANLRALCDVGRSTKAGGNAGYVGQKGIGFKSVFRISNTPKIHSNGLHFKFDASTGPMGYILPQWTDEPIELPPDVLERIVPATSPTALTCIDLPFKPELPCTHLQALLHAVHPTLLLFLNKLRRLVVVTHTDTEDTPSAAGRVMERLDDGDGIVTLLHDGKEDTWILEKQQFQPPVDRDGNTVARTEIAVGFPILPALEFSSPLHSQSVFAFLPIRSYGFRFVLQADWIVTSSREDVSENNAWNQFLRSQIPGLFVKGLERLRRHACRLLSGEAQQSDAPFSTEARACASALRFVPSELEVVGWFRVVAREIGTALRGSPCILTVDGELAMPCSAVLLPQQYPRLSTCVVPPAQLQQYLGLKYVHPLVATAVSRAVWQALQVDTLRATLLVNFVEALIAAQQLMHQPLSWLAQWFVAVESLLAAEEKPDAVLQRLAGLPILPIGEGRLVRVTDGSVWLGVADSQRSVPLLSAGGSLRRVSPEFLAAAEDNEDRVRSLLVRMGVRLPDPDVILEHIIGPIFADGPDRWAKEGPAALVECAQFAKSALETAGNNHTRAIWQRIKQKAVLLTNRGPLQANMYPVHFSQRLGNRWDVRQCHPDPILLSDSYLSDGGSIESWRQFLSELGVTDLLFIRRVQEVLPAKPGAFSEDRVQSDFVCEEFSETVEMLAAPSGSSHHHMLVTLLQFIDAAWEDIKQYCCSTIAPLLDPSVILDSRPSAFVTSLRTLAWVPCSDGRLRAPTDILSPTVGLKSVMDSHGTYAQVALTTPGFSDALGLVCAPSFPLVEKALDKWSQDPHFETSRSHMQSVYDFLLSTLPADRAGATDRVSALKIWLPAPHCKDSTALTEVVVGEWKTIDSVCLHDPSLVIDGTEGAPRVLSRHYPRATEVFKPLEDHIATMPTVEQYCSAIRRLSSCGTVAENGSAVKAILMVLAQRVLKGEENGDDFAEFLPPYSRFVPAAADWMAPAECMLDDRPEITTRFFARGPMHFLRMPAEELGTLAALLRPLGAFLVSTSLSRKVVAENVRSDPKLDELMAFAIEFGQRFIYQQHGLSKLAEFHQSGIRSTLQRLSCRVADELGVVWRLAQNESLCEQRTALWDPRAGVLYATPAALCDFAPLFREFAVVLGLSTSESDSLTEFLLATALISVSGQDADSFVTHTKKLPVLRVEDPAALQPWPRPTVAQAVLFASFRTAAPVEQAPVPTTPAVEKEESFLAPSWPPPAAAPAPAAADDPYAGVSFKRLPAPAYDPKANPVQRVESLQKKAPAVERLRADQLGGSVLSTPAPMTKDTADWAEHLVYQMLRHKFKDRPNVVVSWVNEAGETGKSFDITIAERRGPNATTVTDYVEVKSTTSRTKSVFEISTQEWEFAQLMQEKFTLIAVRGSGRSDATIYTCKNVSQHWRSRTVKLCVVLPFAED